jgi:cytochrome c553
MMTGLLLYHLFHEQCAGCHHSDGSGDKDGFVPSLRNQHYQYLVAQLHRLADGQRRNVDPDLSLFMRSLDDNDMIGVADYLHDCKGPAGRRGECSATGSLSIDAPVTPMPGRPYQPG